MDKKKNSLKAEPTLSMLPKIKDQSSLVSRSFTETMKEVVGFLESNSLKTIKIPFKGTSLQITKDESRVIFSSGISDGEGEKNSSFIKDGSRLAIIDLKSEEVVMDQHVSNHNILTIALSSNDAFAFVAGEEGIVYKLLLADLSVINEYVCHYHPISKIIITSDDAYIFTGSFDGSVKMWDLKKKFNEKTLVQSKQRIYAMDLSINSKYLCVGGEEKVLYVFEISYLEIKSSEILNRIYHSAEIWAVKFSQNCSFLALGDENGDIKVFKFETWDILFNLGMSEKITDLDFSNTEEILISASLNTNIKIWFLSKNKDISYNGHKGCVRRCTLMNNDTKVVSISEDYSIKIWKVPEPESETLFYSNEAIKILKIWVSGNNEIGLLAIEELKIVYIKLNNQGENVEKINLTTNTQSFLEVCPQHLVIICAGLASEEDLKEFAYEKENRLNIVLIYNLKKSKKPRGLLFKSEIKSIFLPQLLKYFIVGENFRFSIYNFQDLTLIQRVYLNGHATLDIIANEENTILYVAGIEEIFYFSFNMNSEESVREMDFKHYSDFLTCADLYLTSNSQYLFILTNRFLEIIHCETFNTILNAPLQYNGFFQNLNDTYCLFTDDHIDIYSLDSFEKLSTIRRKYTINHALTDIYFSTLLVCTNNKIYISENPLNPSKLTLVGDYEYLESFQTYIDLVLAKECTEPYYESLWLIEPYHVNLLHVYAFFNMTDMLRNSIYDEDGDTIPFINSRDNFSPLTIATEMKYIDSINAIIKPIIWKVAKAKSFLPKLLFQSIEEDLIGLNLSGYFSLHSLYKHLYTIDNLAYLPNISPAHFKSPTVIQNKASFFILPKEFGFIQEENLKFESPIIFKKTSAKLYLNLGSQKSIEFMKSLESCKNLKIFETEIIQLILEQKWKAIRWFMYGKTFAYLLYLVMLSLYTSHPSLRTVNFLTASFILSFVIHIYEFIFMIIELKEYFKDIRNIIDILKSWTMILYCFLVWAQVFKIDEKKTNEERYMLSSIIFVSWVRGISYFSVNKKTRYLIKLVYEACTEIIPFLAILFYSILGFSILFTVFKQESLGVVFPFITSSYVIIIGNWDNPKNYDFYSLILFLATLFSPVISLNLLIAILSNTFKKVKHNQIVADSQEMVSMIIELETIMFWNRKNNFKTFFHSMNKDNNIFIDGNDKDKMIRNLRKKIAFLKNDLIRNHKTLESLNEEIHNHSGRVLYSLSNF